MIRPQAKADLTHSLTNFIGLEIEFYNWLLETKDPDENREMIARQKERIERLSEFGLYVDNLPVDGRDTGLID